MPELPDVLLYIEALKSRVLGQPLEHVRLASPFVVRSVKPPISAIAGRKVIALRRLGKQIVFEFEGEIFLVIHLMIAGRFQWKPRSARVPGKLGLAAFDFPSGTLLLTEAGSKKRASLHVVEGESNLAAFDRQALEVLDSTL
jgi:formamidopyrimidine-DNA glycosylase